MENKIKETIRKYNMLSKGDTVVVGLSGGADSCALIHFLSSVKDDFSLTLIACHVNHMIRGDEADRDEEFSRNLAIELGAEFRLLKINVPQEAEKRHESIEKTARDIRYDFFEKTAEQYNAKIATAHTASDNVETVLFNLARGSGIKGLCGIPPVRGRIIRPLITVERDEIEKYCRKNELNYVTDSTNLTDEYSRNKLRHKVVPVLKEINPAIEKTITRMTENLICNVKHLDSSAEKLIKSASESSPDDNLYKADILYRADEAVFSRVIAILLESFGVIPEAVHIALVRDICTRSGAVQIKGNIFAVSKQGYLRIIEKSGSITQDNISVPFLQGNGVVINNKKISLEKYSLTEINKAENCPEKNIKIMFNNRADYDTIDNEAVFRYRSEGDRFRLPGRGFSKSLKKLFNEMKIPAERRNRILVLASGHDIIWIEGIGFSEGYLAGKKTNCFLRINITDLSNKGE